MTTFEITAPDGTKYHVQGPDGATEQDALAQVQAQHAQPKYLSFDVLADGSRVPTGSPEAIAARSPVAGNSGLDNVVQGYGHATVDLWRGIKERALEAPYAVMDAVSPNSPTLSNLVTGKQPLSRVEQLHQTVADQRQLDAPLMATRGGKIGNFTGTVANLIPAAFIPGANTVAGAAAIGAGTGFIQPTASNKETLLNTGLGAAAGAAGQWIGNKVSTVVSNRLAARQTAAADEQAQNAVRDQVLKQGRDAGYVIAPTDVNPSAAATALESVSGKAATRQAAQARNQVVTNGLIRQDLGIAENTPITRGVTSAVRAKAGQAYQAVKDALSTFKSDQAFADDLASIRQGAQGLEKAYPGIGSQASPEIEALVKSLAVDAHNGPEAIGLSKFLRNRAAQNFKAAFGQGGNPDKLALAQAQSQAAGAIEDLIQRTLKNSGDGALADAWNSARTTIAKAYQVDAALKGGNVSATRLAQQFQKGKPLSGGMGLVARFADQFGEVSKLPKGGAGVSKLAATMAGAGTIGATAVGGPAAGLGTAALAVAPYAVRKGILSGAGQSIFATPSYAPSLLGTGYYNALNLIGRGGAPLSLATQRQLVNAPQ